MTEKNVSLSEYFSTLGKVGGRKLKEAKLKDDPNYYKRLSDLAVAAKKAKKQAKELSTGSESMAKPSVE